MFVEFMEDDLGVELRQHIGVDNMLWGSDFPHAEFDLAEVSGFPGTPRSSPHIRGEDVDPLCPCQMGLFPWPRWANCRPAR